MKLLVTGATGKVGQNFLPAFLNAPRFAEWTVRALCHNRTIPESDRVEVLKGSISEQSVAAAAMDGVTHVLHMSAVKETVTSAMDVSVKGMFWLLEEFRQSKDARQFVLIGGDCSVGHIIQRYDEPVTETSPRRPYPGVYALSKVLEETMLEQYYIQYGINGCCLRAPWIMEKDDFRYALSFGDDQFGGPPWTDFMTRRDADTHHRDGRIPLMLDHAGHPLKRNFVHVSDLVTAILAALDNPAAHQELFNIAMNRPVDYAEVAAHLEQSLGLKAVTVPTPHFSNWLDNTKARLRLGWEPAYDLRRLVDEAFAYERAPDDPRIVWYPG